MRLYIDTETNQFVVNPLQRAPIDSVSFKRGDAAQVNIQFTNGSTVLSAVSSRDVKFGIKASGNYDGDYLVFTDDYTMNGNDYVLTPSFNTAGLNTILGSDSLTGNDVASVNTMLEVTWSDDGSSWYSSNTITATINNDVNKGLEGTPVELPSPEDWLAEQFDYLEAEADPLVTLTSDEDATVVTLNVPAGTWDIQGMGSLNFALATAEEYSSELRPSPTVWDSFGALESLVDYDGTRKGFTQLKRVVLTEETAFSMVAYCLFTDGDVYAGGKITARKVPA